MSVRSRPPGSVRGRRNVGMPEVGRRRAQLVQRRVGGGRIGLRALVARAARRDQQDAGDARPREVRRQLAALGGSGRDHVEGRGRARRPRRPIRGRRGPARAPGARAPRRRMPRAAPRAARRPRSRRAGGRPAARRWSSSRRSVGRQAGGAPPDTVRASVAGSPGWARRSRTRSSSRRPNSPMTST